MRGKRYQEEFKIEAVKPVTELGYTVTDVARGHRKSAWTIDTQQDEIRQLIANKTPISIRFYNRLERFKRIS